MGCCTNLIDFCRRTGIDDLFARLEAGGAMLRIDRTQQPRMFHYATISEGVDSARNVITLEDPVEIELPGVTQVHVDEKVGMTFGRGLRAALRQDPDVILVGEMRDLAMVSFAVTAAETGHLVLGTVHTSSADLRAELVQLRRVAARAAASVGARLLPVAVPPCAGVSIDPAPTPGVGLGLDTAISALPANSPRMTLKATCLRRARCSAMYTAAPPHSPPSARPCSTRSRMNITGAAMPIWA